MADRPTPGGQPPQYPNQGPSGTQPQPGWSGQQQPGYPSQDYGQAPPNYPPQGYPPGPGYPQPGGYPPPGHQQPKKRGGLATTSLVLGIIGIILGVIPFANFGAYPFVVLAIIFGLFALSWGKAKAGVILGVIGLIATIVWTVAIGSVFNDAVNKNHTVVYRVMGSIPKADVSYYASDGSGNDTNQSQDGVALPFSKTVTVKGDFSGFVLQANTPITTSSPSGTLSCTLSVDGKVVSRDSASGSANYISCDGSGYDGN